MLQATHTYLIVRGDGLISDELYSGCVVAVGHSSANNLEPLLSGGGDQGAPVRSVLHRVDTQNSPTACKWDPAEEKQLLLRSQTPYEIT